MGLDTAKLSASRTSAKEQYESDIEQINLDKYVADVAADNAKTLNLLFLANSKPKPPEMISEPLKPNFDAIRKLNKSAGQALVSPASGSLLVRAQALGQLSQTYSSLSQPPSSSNTDTDTDNSSSYCWYVPNRKYYDSINVDVSNFV